MIVVSKIRKQSSRRAMILIAPILVLTYDRWHLKIFISNYLCKCRLPLSY